MADKQKLQDMIERGEAALARWSISNPMRPTIERNVAWAKSQLARVSA
jgi:hypothetical protein